MRSARKTNVAVWLERGFTRREKVSLGFEIVRAYARARWLLWRTDLPTAVATLRASVPAGDTPDAQRAGVRLGQIVSRVLGRLPFDSRCLMRSLVLIDLLAARGLRATLVVAVTPEPEFRAHAWVERDDVPLLEPEGPPFERLVEI